MRQRSISNNNSFPPPSFVPEKNSFFPQKKYLETFQKDFFSPGPGVRHPPRSPLQRDLRPHQEDQEAGGAGWVRQDHQTCFCQYKKSHFCYCFCFQSMTSGTPPTTLSRSTSRHVCLKTFPNLHSSILLYPFVTSRLRIIWLEIKIWNWQASLRTLLQSLPPFCRLRRSRPWRPRSTTSTTTRRSTRWPRASRTSRSWWIGFFMFYLFILLEFVLLLLLFIVFGGWPFMFLGKAILFRVPTCSQGFSSSHGFDFLLVSFSHLCPFWGALAQICFYLVFVPLSGGTTHTLSKTFQPVSPLFT